MFVYVILCFLLYVFYRHVWVIYKMYHWHSENFRKQGYRVLEVPFKPFAVTMKKYYSSSQNTIDALNNVKQDYPNYDVAVMNSINRVYIELAHPELLQEFLSSENMQHYTKASLGRNPVRRGLGEGLLFSEGNSWKMKRKVLTQVFNFDFLKRLAPKIAGISDYALEKVEK